MTTEQMVEKLDEFQAGVGVFGDGSASTTTKIDKENFEELGAPFEVWRAFITFTQGFWDKAGLAINMELMTGQLNQQLFFVSTILTGLRLGWMLRGEVQGVEELNKMMGVSDE